MADELQYTLSGSLTNGKLSDPWKSETVKVTQAAQGAHLPVVSVGTSEEDLAVGDVGTVGFLWVKNLDAANYVTYGPKSAGAMIAFGRIKSGEVHLIRLEPGVTLRWQANTAAVKVQTRLYEN